MPTFEYQIQKPDGSTESGTAIGTSLDSVAAELAAKGMRVTRIGIASSIGDPLQNFAPVTPIETPRNVETPVAKGNPYDHPAPVERSAMDEKIIGERSYIASSVVGPLVGKVALADLAFFFRQSATMLKAGVPVVQSFDTLSRQSKSPKLRSVVAEIARHVEAGRPISYGMQRYPEVFTPIMLSLLRAGEEGGFVDSALETIANYIDDELKIRNLYRRVTFYPKLELAFSAIIILATNMILASVKPGAKGLNSPLTTPATWIWLGPLLIAIFLFLRVGLANPRVKYNWDLIVSSLPYIGKTLRQLAMARFGRAFGALYHGGVPMTRAVVLAADACGNEYLRGRIYPAATQLEQGRGIGETLASTGAFSPIVLDMVNTGERTGNLDHMLNKVADFYSDEAQTRSTQLGYMIGAVVALCVAIYIGYIVISFYMTNYGPSITNAVNES